MSNLRDLEVDSSATVGEISAQGVFRERLYGMGVVPGNRLSVIRQGAPMIVDVCGGRIALAGELAAQIEVTDVVRHRSNGGSGGPS